MQSLIEAIGTLRVHALAQEAADEALDALIRRALRMEKALNFYKDERNYIDGVPLHVGPSGMMDIEDRGAFARQALGEDVPLGLVIKLPEAA